MHELCVDFRNALFMNRITDYAKLLRMQVMLAAGARAFSDFTRITRIVKLLARIPCVPDWDGGDRFMLEFRANFPNARF
jgi:hypothetical protein